MTPEQEDALRQCQSKTLTALKAANRLIYLSALKEVPGKDLVLAVANDGERSLPDSGWVVGATIIPGEAGTIEIYHFNKGGMEIKPGQGKEAAECYSEHGSAHIYTTFSPVDNLVIGCENVAYPFKDKQPYTRTGVDYIPLGFESLDILELSQGDRLLSSKPQPLFPDLGRSLSTSFTTQNIDTESRRRYVPQARIEASRITDNMQELSAIIGHLSLGMGLGDQDVATVVDVSMTKLLQYSE